MSNFILSNLSTILIVIFAIVYVVETFIMFSVRRTVTTYSAIIFTIATIAVSVGITSLIYSNVAWYHWVLLAIAIIF